MVQANTKGCRMQTLVYALASFHAPLALNDGCMTSLSVGPHRRMPAAGPPLDGGTGRRVGCVNGTFPKTTDAGGQVWRTDYGGSNMEGLSTLTSVVPTILQPGRVSFAGARTGSQTGRSLRCAARLRTGFNPLDSPSHFIPGVDPDTHMDRGRRRRPRLSSQVER